MNPGRFFIFTILPVSFVLNVTTGSEWREVPLNPPMNVAPEFQNGVAIWNEQSKKCFYGYPGSTYAWSDREALGCKIHGYCLHIWKGNSGVALTESDCRETGLSSFIRSRRPTIIKLENLIPRQLFCEHFETPSGFRGAIVDVRLLSNGIDIAMLSDTGAKATLTVNENLSPVRIEIDGDRVPMLLNGIDNAGEWLGPTQVDILTEAGGTEKALLIHHGEKEIGYDPQNSILWVGRHHALWSTRHLFKGSIYCIGLEQDLTLSVSRSGEEVDVNNLLERVQDVITTIKNTGIERESIDILSEVNLGPTDASKRGRLFFETQVRLSSQIRTNEIQIQIWTQAFGEFNVSRDSSGRYWRLDKDRVSRFKLEVKRQVDQ